MFVPLFCFVLILLVVSHGQHAFDWFVLKVPSLHASLCRFFSNFPLRSTVEREHGGGNESKMPSNPHDPEEINSSQIALTAREQSLEVEMTTRHASPGKPYLGLSAILPDCQE